jgi:hypothetical protein
MRKMTNDSKRGRPWAWLKLGLAAALVVPACALTTEDKSGETHFVQCKTDVVCRDKLGDDYYCPLDHCVKRTDAGVSDAVSSGGSRATANGEGGGNATGGAQPEAAIVGSPAGGQLGVLDGGMHVDCTEGLVWKPTSTRVAIQGSAQLVASPDLIVFNGSTRYEKDVADLSAEQVMALQKLCVADHLNRPETDFKNYLLTVKDTGARDEIYYAAENDLLPQRDIDVGYLTIESLSRFLTTFRCRATREPPSTTRLGDAGLTDDALPVLSTDPGCYDGAYFSSASDKQYFKVPIATPGALKVEAVDCFQTMSLRLLTSEGLAELASTGPKSAPECPALQVHVMSAGSYVLEVQKENDSAPDAGIPTAGDFYLRHSLTP